MKAEPAQAAPTGRTGQPAAVIVMPSLQGHRHVYCRAIAGVVRELGYTVVIATPLDEPGDRRRAGTLGAVVLHDTAPVPEDERCSLAALSALRAAHDAGVLVLAEADEYIPALAELRAGGAQALPGRVVALFIRSTNYVHAPPPSALRSLARRLRGPRQQTASDPVVFHETLADGDAALTAVVLDERFAAAHRRSHSWLPDIYREFEAIDQEEAEQAAWGRALESFLAVQRDRPVIVYVGTNQVRRGYDTLVRLAADLDGCLIHCGRLDAGDESLDESTRRFRDTLAKRNALLETVVHYTSPRTAELFLTAARCVVLPYREHDGSSGVMLQAVAAGRPVLVPDRGLMGWRVREFGVGEVYDDGDWAGLRQSFIRLCERGPKPYGPALAAYAACFTQERVERAIRRAVTGHGPAARLPQDALAGPGSSPLGGGATE
jgi:glycosyltransferase involved in cell wall biosynthesis